MMAWLSKASTRRRAVALLLAAVLLGLAWARAADVSRARVAATEAAGRLTQQRTRLDSVRAHGAQAGWDASAQSAAEDAISRWAKDSLSWDSAASRKVPKGCEAMGATDAAAVTSVDVWPREAGTWLALVTRSDGTWAVEVAIDSEGTPAATSATLVKGL